MHFERKIGARAQKKGPDREFRRMVEHSLKDSKVETAECVFQRGREKNKDREAERDGPDVEPLTLINQQKHKYLFLGD